MRISVWHSLLWSRYKAVVFSELIKICSERNHEVSIIQIAETDSARASLSPVDMHWNNYPYTLLFKGSYDKIHKLNLYWRVAAVTISRRSDITLIPGYSKVEYWVQALILLLTGQKFGVFCDSTAFDNHQSVLKNIPKRLLLSLSSLVFCYGERSAEYAAWLGAAPQKIVRRCQAAALVAPYDPIAARLSRAALAAKAELPCFLYVGRLSPEKGLETLLQAFNLVRKKNVQAKLRIVGRGPQEAQLRTLISSLALDGAVEFVGAKYDEELVNEYVRASCLVLPSYSEPWGLVVNEALSYGCPVVVSDRCGCVPELVREGVTGYAFRSGDPLDLANKLTMMIESVEDVTTVAARCIDCVGPFSAAAAAKSILKGCENV